VVGADQPSQRRAHVDLLADLDAPLDHLRVERHDHPRPLDVEPSARHGGLGGLDAQRGLGLAQRGLPLAQRGLQLAVVEAREHGARGQLCAGRQRGVDVRDAPADLGAKQDVAGGAHDPHRSELGSKRADLGPGSLDEHRCLLGRSLTLGLRLRAVDGPDRERAGRGDQRADDQRGRDPNDGRSGAVVGAHVFSLRYDQTSEMTTEP
jgi:hypothetical protein